jgi:acetyl esterase/lipase
MIRTKLRSALAAFRRLARGAEGRGFGGSAPSVDIAAPLTTQIISLWPEGAPGAEARRNEAERARDWWVKNVHSPSLTAFFPAREAANGAAVIIAPGGGHRELVFEAEGIEPARFLARLGVTAFALKYRLAREPGSTYDIERDAGADMRRAVRLVRSRAAEWAIDAARVGAMGWSAGGELAAMVAFRPVLGDPRASDPIERASARPDFLILVYPGDYAMPDEVPADAPQAFLVAASDDDGPARTIMSLWLKYRRAGVPVEAHLFAEGQHAFNMGARSSSRGVQDWPSRLVDWLADRRLLARR